MKPQGYGSAMLSFKFEAAHRQPQLGGKCVNLHGHSWNVNVTLFNKACIGGITEQGVSVEFGLVKTVIRKWIDDHFDHAVLLGMEDPLTPVMENFDQRLFTFGTDGDYEAIAWPSVEAVAFCLGEKLQELLTSVVGNYVIIESVMVSETETNTFFWNNPATETDKDYGEMHMQTVRAIAAESEPCL